MNRRLPRTTRHLSPDEIQYRGFDVLEYAESLNELFYGTWDERLSLATKKQEALKRKADTAREARLGHARDRKRLHAAPSPFEGFWAGDDCSIEM